MNEPKEITLKVFLDEKEMPDRIVWDASGRDLEEPNELKAFMLSIWDKNSSETMRMDIWTTDMRKDEMDKFFFQTLMTMADTYKRANNDEKITDDIRRFAYKFGERTKLIKRQDD